MTDYKIRVLVLGKYGRFGASTRVRMLQYFRILRESGLEIHESHFFDEEYIRQIYGMKGKRRIRYLKYFLRRLAALAWIPKSDVIWIEGEIFPYFPASIERFFRLIGKPFVVDYDDAIFHRYDMSRNSFVRGLLGKKIDRVMEAANAVVVGNDYLKSRASSAGVKNPVVIPTVIDISKYGVRFKNANPDGRVMLGWIGNPGTAKYLKEIFPALLEVCRDGNTALTCIGSGPVSCEGLDLTVKEWSEVAEGEDISHFDIGVMPLPDRPFERGKCGYKLLQYMACGLPVVASPVGANMAIVRHNVTGFLASSQEEWINYLRRLAEDEGLRRKFGKAAREIVEEEYSLRVKGHEITNVLKKAATECAE